MFKRFSHLIKPSLIRNYSDNENVLNILQKGQIGQQIYIKGWVKSLRKQKELTFIDIGDGSTPKNLQIILSKKLDTKIDVGSSVQASGILKLNPKGQMEVSADNIIIFQECDVTKGYPFAPKKYYQPEYVRQFLHFRLRTRKFSSVLRLRHATTLAMHKYLDNNNYINIQTPIITSNDCEGAGEIFSVIPDNEDLLKSVSKENTSPAEAYFNKKVYLTVSGQLHLEAAVHSLKKVYCFGPTFRAENSRTRHHLSEFYMLELEQAFLDNLEDLLDITENLVKNVAADVLEKHKDDIEICTENKVDHSWINKKFITISYDESLDILKNKLHKAVDKTGGLSKEDELSLVEYFKNVPVFVINWPKENKPFYMKEVEESKVAAFDLLAPGIGEIVGGSLREHNYDKLKSRIPVGNSHLDWYLDLRKFGGVPTGGFGLGFERYIQFILGIQNIKDSIPFPRWPHHCDL